MNVIARIPIFEKKLSIFLYSAPVAHSQLGRFAPPTVGCFVMAGLDPAIHENTLLRL